MFRPVLMMRLRLLILQPEARAVLRELGRAGVMQLTLTPAGPDTAPLPPHSHAEDLSRLERSATRLENLRTALGLGPGGQGSNPVEMSLDEVEKRIQSLLEQSGELLTRRQQLEQRLDEIVAVSEQISAYHKLDLPLDKREDTSFLHFVTGSLPADNFKNLAGSGDLALMPTAERDGRQYLIAMTTRPGRPELDRILQQAGFRPEILPVASGTTTAALAEKNQREQEQIAVELKATTAKLQTLVTEISPAWSQMETATGTERRLLEAEQNFPRTENALLITGWVSASDIAAVKSKVEEITQGRHVLEATPAEQIAEAEIPIRLRHPRWLRPFAMLVKAYGLPGYHELEPTLFVAISYLLMFGIMFGDVGHGLTVGCVGLAILWRSRQTTLRDVGLLLLFCGASSMLFGAIYGSYFGLPGMKQFALWHDPLEGNPLGFMSAAIGIGIVLMSIGLLLNVINQVRRGHILGALLDKFGVAGIVFYWGALLLLLNYPAIQSKGLAVTAVVLFLLIPILGWILKEPVEFLRKRPAGHAEAKGSLFGSFMGSLLEVFEGLMSYFSNTISFVRLAAYAMSHSALLLAAFMMAEQVKHIPAAGGALSVLAIILGNLVAIVLEGIVAGVQALRLEYYEFFSKFFAGNGQPFRPFCLTARQESQAG